MKNNIQKILTSTSTKIAIAIGTIGILIGSIAYAGSLTPSASPVKTMYTLGDIYTLLTTGTTTASTNFTAPGSVSPTFNSLSDLVAAFSSSTQNLVTGNIKNGVSVLGVTGTAAPGQLIQTGQTICYDSGGTVISCSGTGQDAEFEKGATISFIDNGDGTVTDNNTGLIWQQANDGVNRNWSDALTYCNTNAAGLPGSGWRLPNVLELMSITDFSQSSPYSLNPTYFPGSTVGSNLYWTSTTVQYTGLYGQAITVRFNNGGYTGYNGKGTGAYVRCVRG